MKKLFVALSFISFFVFLSGCSKESFEEGKEELKEAFNEKAGLSGYLKDNNEAIDQYNQYIDLFNHAMENIEDLTVLTEKIEKEIIPSLDEAIILSNKGEYKVSLYGALKKERTEAMMKSKEGMEKLLVLYKTTDFTEEEEFAVFSILDESFELFKKYETHLVEAGKEMNETIKKE